MGDWEGCALFFVWVAKGVIGEDRLDGTGWSDFLNERREW